MNDAAATFRGNPADGPILDTIVIGAGISGLAVAHGLARRKRTHVVLESGPCAGGVIGTGRRDGFLFELGPNSTLDTTPLINELLADLGIADERLDASMVASTRYVVRGGKLVALPTSPGAFATTSAFTLAAKLRLFAEPFVARTAPGTEESIATFVRRRLGNEFLDYAIDPFVAGIYAGDPERISVAAAFPRLLALEQRYGSLIKGQILGARERRKNKEVAKNAASSFSFRGGMQTLTDALVQSLATVQVDTSVRQVTRDATGTFTVEAIRGGQPVGFRARSLVLAVPAYVAARIIGNIAPAAAAALNGIEYTPIAIVANAWRREDIEHSLAGFGFLVPKKEHRFLLGGLFSSSMFAGRAPAGHVLLTTFAGGRRNPGIAGMADNDIAAMVREELTERLGARAAPLWQQTVRWPQAIPQYELGHLDRLRQVDAAESAVRGLYFCANYRDGVAVGDRIKLGHAMASRIGDFLAAPAPDMAAAVSR
jgi:oxygen-dependent protoporphyrinogen oxidase